MNYSTWDSRVKRKRFNSESGAKPATGLGSESPLGWGGCAESTPDEKPSFQQDTVMGGAAYAPWWSHSHLISRPTQALTSLHAFGWSCFVITETRSYYLTAAHHPTVFWLPAQGQCTPLEPSKKAVISVTWSTVLEESFRKSKDRLLNEQLYS